MRISDWSSDVCSSDLSTILADGRAALVLDPGAIAAGVAKRPRAGAKAGQAAGRGELPLLLFRTRGDPALKGVPLSRLVRIEQVNAATDGPSDRKSTRLNSRH